MRPSDAEQTGAVLRVATPVCCRCCCNCCCRGDPRAFGEAKPRSIDNRNDGLVVDVAVGVVVAAKERPPRRGGALAARQESMDIEKASITHAGSCSEKARKREREKPRNNLGKSVFFFFKEKK